MSPKETRRRMKVAHEMRMKRDAIKKEQADRGRARRFLAQQMGMFMLNELELVGCFSIKDYANIRPKSVINAWVNEFGTRRAR